MKLGEGGCGRESTRPCPSPLPLPSLPAFQFVSPDLTQRPTALSTDSTLLLEMEREIFSCPSSRCLKRVEVGRVAIDRVLLLTVRRKFLRKRPSHNAIQNGESVID